MAFFSLPIPKPHPSLPPLRCSSSSSSNNNNNNNNLRPSFDLRTYWSTLISEIEPALDSALAVQYPPLIYETMRHSVLSSGAAKRAPPVLCVASCELIAGPSSRPSAFPTACALELLHAASLIHDDLPSMDSSPLRRGLPSTHSLFGVDLAVLAGDALLPLAFHHLLSLTPPSSSLARVVAEIARAVGSTGMAGGQFLDLFFDECDQTEEEVVRVLEKKFGEMAECSAVCGGILGGAEEEEVERLRRYGRAVGVLNQVVDDVMMVEGAVGGKMRSNASVVRVVGMERALEMVEELRERAKRELDGFGDKYGERVLPLYTFVDYAVERGFVLDNSSSSVESSTVPSSSF